MKLFLIITLSLYTQLNARFRRSAYNAVRVSNYGAPQGRTSHGYGRPHTGAGDYGFGPHYRNTARYNWRHRWEFNDYDGQGGHRPYGHHRTHPKKSSYGHPTSTYSRPTSSYGRPTTSSYGPPRSTYKQPVSNYAPKASYEPPKSNFGIPESVQTSADGNIGPTHEPSSTSFNRPAPPPHDIQPHGPPPMLEPSNFSPIGSTRRGPPPPLTGTQGNMNSGSMGPPDPLTPSQSSVGQTQEEKYPEIPKVFGHPTGLPGFSPPTEPAGESPLPGSVAGNPTSRQSGVSGPSSSGPPQAVPAQAAAPQVPSPPKPSLPPMPGSQSGLPSPNIPPPPGLSSGMPSPLQIPPSPSSATGFPSPPQSAVPSIPPPPGLPSGPPQLPPLSGSTSGFPSPSQAAVPNIPPPPISISGFPAPPQAAVPNIPPPPG